MAAMVSCRRRACSERASTSSGRFYCKVVPDLQYDHQTSTGKRLRSAKTRRASCCRAARRLYSISGEHRGGAHETWTRWRALGPGLSSGSKQASHYLTRGSHPKHGGGSPRPSTIMRILNGYRLLLLASALALAISLTHAAPANYEPNWRSLDQRPCPSWYLDAKFGIFIHWGVYSVPAWDASKEYAEWYWNRIEDKSPGNVWRQFHEKHYGKDFPYQNFAPMFRAELFNPDQWADIFYRSGAKYIVPTSKHHEGL